MKYMNFSYLSVDTSS